MGDKTKIKDHISKLGILTIFLHVVCFSILVGHFAGNLDWSENTWFVLLDKTLVVFAMIVLFLNEIFTIALIIFNKFKKEKK